MLKDKLNGLVLSIVDEIAIENLSFTGDVVTATIGVKGGAVCGPVLSFVVTGDDSLVIDSAGFNLRWSYVEIADNAISVIRNGKPTVYHIVSKSGGLPSVT